MTKIFDCIIIGAGIIGLSAALAMKQRGYSVAVLDAGNFDPQTESENNRVYAVNQASAQLLESLSIWQDLPAEKLSPYRQMQVWDAASKAEIQFDCRLLGIERLGSIVEESLLKQALLQKASSQDIAVFSGERVIAISQNSEVNQSSGLALTSIETEKQPYQASLVIVADGALSSSRDLLGVPISSWPYHQQAIVATVKTRLPHGNTAFQIFNPDGPLAFLPLAEKNCCSIVWSTSSKSAQELLSIPDEQFNQRLSAAFQEKLGPVEVQSKRKSFPLFMRHSKQYSGQSWLLMGDAAHSIHPLAGLGLNLGLEDLAVWLRLLDESKRQPWDAVLLQKYQRNRSPEVWKVIFAMEAIKALFANPLPLVAKLRSFGLYSCNQLPWLKRFFIRQASGAV